MSTLGKHWAVELYDCNPSLLKRVGPVEEILVATARRCKAAIIEMAFHEFNPFGVSGMVIIAESHLAIHTWPEFKYAAVDIFTCGETLVPDQAAGYIAQRFEAARMQIFKLPRGRFDATGNPMETRPETILEKIQETASVASVRQEF